MDNRTIFSKTGKGSLEISKKSLKLSSDERQALILVDGKSSLGQLEEKLNRVPPVKLRAIFEQLLAFDLIREFITKGGPDSVMAVPGSAAAAMRVMEITEDDLDFTAFAAVVKNNPVQETSAQRQAAEAAAKQAGEAAERKARDDAARKGQEEALLRERARLAEETKRKGLEEAARKAADEAARLAREAAERKVSGEAAQAAREEAAHKAREVVARATQAEAERKAREEAERKTREQAEREARANAEARERARQEEESVRREIAARQAAEEAQRKHREDAERRRVEAAAEQERALQEEQQRLATQLIEEQRRAEEEAARYTAALTPHLEAAAAPVEPVNGPAPMGAFANLSALEANAPDAVVSGSAAPAPQIESANARGTGEKQSRKQDEKAAKERAKQEARARKEAEKEARKLAREDAAGSPRGRSIGAGKMIGAILLLVIGAAVAYVFSLSADKPAIEKMLSARFGTQVTVGEARFTPFPAELRLANVAIGDIKLPLLVASADPVSLASNDKVWRNVDITGMDLSPAQVERLAALASTETNRATAIGFTLQRVRVLGVNISGTPVALPKFDATLLLGQTGALKQATLALPDGRAQVLLAPDEKGWLVDIESRGVVWPLGPKVAWESLRAKGVATRAGIKFDDIALTVGSGGVRATGELTWSAGWKYTGTIEINSIDAETIGSAIYAATPVAGPVESKLEVSMAAPTLPRLFEAPQLDGSFVMSKAVFKTVDFARLLQGGDPGGGQTRLPELTGNLSASAGRLQLRQLRGSSGLLSIAGGLDVLPDNSLSGTASVELGASGSRGRANLKVTGTVADPRFSR